MSPKQRKWFFQTAVLLALMAPLLAACYPGQTIGWQRSISIPSGTPLEQDLLLLGSEITLDQDVQGDVLAIGQKVNINGQVAGSLVALGDQVRLSGNVDGSVYTAAVGFTLEPGSTIGHSLYAAAISLSTGAGSKIGRDLLVVSAGANLAGQVGRNTQAVIGILPILDLLTRGLGPLLPGDIRTLLPKSSFLPGQTPWPAAQLGSLAGARLPEQIVLLQAAAPQAVDARTWALDQLRLLASLLIVGALLLWLFPTRFENATQKLKERPWASLGLGIVVLITGTFGTVVLAALFLAIGFTLAYFSLGGFAWLFWTISLGLLIALYAAFIVMVIYGTKCLLSYLAGKMILGRLFPQGAALPHPPPAVGPGDLRTAHRHSLPWLGNRPGSDTARIGRVLAGAENQKDQSRVIQAG